MAIHVELSRFWGSCSGGLQVLEGPESSCVLSVLACCFFGRLFLLVPAYFCLGGAGCSWVYPEPMLSTDTNFLEWMLVYLFCFFGLDVCSCSPVSFSGNVFFSCFGSLPLGLCGGLFLFSGFSSFGVSFMFVLGIWQIIPVLFQLFLSRT